MQLGQILRAAVIAIAVSPMPALATICGTHSEIGMIDGLFDAGLEPVVVSGFPMSDGTWQSERVTDFPPVGLGMYTSTISYRILGFRAGDGGWAYPAVVEATVDVGCESGNCGDLPKRFEPRTFILWEGEDGLIGLGGLCGPSIRPLVTPLQSIKIRWCLATRDCD